MCAIGYRACANDMITLTHLTNEVLPNASLLKRLRLRRGRKRAIDALSEARKALPPGALRATPQERNRLSGTQLLCSSRTCPST